MRRILFSSKCFDVEVKDTFGNVLVVFTGVPGNSHDEAVQLCKGKITYSAMLSNTDSTFKAVSGVQAKGECLMGL
jgi:hypothetical protein